MTYEDLLTRIMDFAANNSKWIEKVGVDCLRRSQLTVTNFMKGLHIATILFDKVCLTVACRAFNVHCVILLEGGYWSTRPNNDFSDCLLKIAYVGDYGFKELCTESSLLFSEHEFKDSKNLSDLDGDLPDTGLFGPESDSGKAACDTDDTQNQEQMDCNNNNDDDTQTKEQMDVKPPLMCLQCLFTKSADNPFVLSDEEQVDVKPLILAKCLFTTDEPIVLWIQMKIHLIHLLHRPWTMTSNNLLNLHLLQIKINPDISVSSMTEIILAIFATNSLRWRVFSFHITMKSIQMTVLNASFVTHIMNHTIVCLNIKGVICT